MEAVVEHAGPGGADDHGAHGAVAVDEVVRGRGPHGVKASDGARKIQQDGEGEVVPPNVGAHSLFRLQDVDGEHFESALTVLEPQRLELLHRRDAVMAPSRPKVDDHWAAGKGRKGDGLVIEVGEGEVGSRLVKRHRPGRFVLREDVFGRPGIARRPKEPQAQGERNGCQEHKEDAPSDDH